MRHKYFASTSVTLLALHASVTQAIPVGSVGDEVGLYINGPVTSETRIGTFPTDLFADANLGLRDGDSSAGVYASARAHAGTVGAAVFLDWVYPIDYWGAGAQAVTSDLVSISNPAFANQTVSVLVHANVNGGLAIGGAAAHANAKAYFAFDGIAGLTPYFGSPGAYYGFSGGTGFGQIFTDRAYQEVIGYNDSGTIMNFRTRYEYSPRWNTYQVDVLLDGSGNGTFWTQLDVDVSAGEDGTSKFFGDPAATMTETGRAAADYGHTVNAYYSGLTPGTVVTSAAGWANNMASVPVPGAGALMLSALGLMASWAVGRNKATRPPEQT